MESADTTAPLLRRASSTATSDLPEAVGPPMTSRGIFLAIDIILYVENAIANSTILTFSEGCQAKARKVKKSTLLYHHSPAGDPSGQLYISFCQGPVTSQGAQGQQRGSLHHRGVKHWIKIDKVKALGCYILQIIPIIRLHQFYSLGQILKPSRSRVIF